VGDKLAFSVDYYDIDPDNTPIRMFAELRFKDGTGAVQTGTNQLIMLGMNNNIATTLSGGNFWFSRILGYNVPTTEPDGGPDNALTGAGAYFKLNDFANSPIRDPDGAATLAAFHNLKVEISTSNGTSQDYKYYVDGVLAETVNGVASALRQYNVIRLGVGLSSARDAYFDNVRLEFTPAPTAGLLGDFNNDNKVDAADYITWRENDTANAALPNDNALATQAERYDLWKANFGNPPASGAALGSAAVPEPATIALLLVVLGMVAAGRRR
jgi:PEP-CTERM motif